MRRNIVASALFLVAVFTQLRAATEDPETFVGSFAEPADGGNIDTRYSTFDGSTVTIVPRAHPNEAVNGATRWRNVLFAIRGMQGLAPRFRLPLTSPGSGRMILQGDNVSFHNVKLVWSYERNPARWNTFDEYARTGTAAWNWTIEARNAAVFTQDVVYVSINEHAPVADFYEWLEGDVLTHPLVSPTPSQAAPGSFIIGYQSGAAASAACSRPIADMPLFGFVIRDPAANPGKLVMLVSGQHPYEGQNKVALQAALDWILNSTTAEARAYRQQYVTVVYPFVNPTGELAGLWRGTAFDPRKDTNRNWDTLLSDPAQDRGIDTVIVHKNAMRRDIAALGLGEPYALFDYHQNFGDRPDTLDYVLHSTPSDSPDAPVARLSARSEFAPYFARLSGQTSIADMPSDPTTQETLRGYMVARGVALPLTFERSVYNTLASEWDFGIATIRSLVDPATLPPPAPVVTDLVVDDFTGGGVLARRLPDALAWSGQRWSVLTGVFTLDAAGAVSTNISSRAVIETGAADAEVSSIVRLGANDTGLILRASDSANYLRFVINSGGWILQKTAAGGTRAVVSGRTPYALNADHFLTATLEGAVIALEIDGQPVGSAQVTFNQDATRHGLLSSGSGVRSWGSFAVRTRD